jgi:membrane-associated protease RseP (regulator of RpoE activity)
MVMSAYSLCFILFLSVPTVLLVHEVGHLLTARWYGIPVLGLSIGFGPELLGLTDRRGTRWSLAAIPLGAFVKIPASRVLDTVLQKQKTSIAELRRRAAIFAAGPLANLLLACVIYGSSYLILGEAAVVPSPQFEPPTIVMSLIAGFSMFVALFNLVPIPPLDGGFIALIGIEALTRKQIPEYVQSLLCKVGLGIISVSSLFFSIYEMAPLVRSP